MTPANSNAVGRRAEEVASWYFRLNGVLHIPSFVLHSERAGEQLTDSDILGVRFPYSSEMLGEELMQDDDWLVQLSEPGKTLVVLSEVKSGLCKINGPWTDPSRGGMERVIRRIGFLPEEYTKPIAASLYEKLYWENEHFRVQYVSVGERRNHELRSKYPDLVQLQWSDVASFLFERFQNFGTLKGIPSQWPTFGESFAKSVANEAVSTTKQAVEFVRNYIRTGRIVSL